MENSLTPRELEVVKLICEDLPYKLIADRLEISFNTANNHIRNINKKLKVHSKVAIVKFAYENGIVST